MADIVQGIFDILIFWYYPWPRDEESEWLNDLAKVIAHVSSHFNEDRVANR